MSDIRFDTFEDEIEISKLITMLQSQSIKHMKRYDAWEVPEMTNPVKSKRKMAIANS